MRAMAANSLSAETVLRWLQYCAETFDAHKDELTQLDAAIGDRYGRRRALMLSVLLMCGGSLAIAVTPNYETIGVGATILAEKICGAAAEAGQSLAEVRDLCKKVNAQGRSMGMALTSCTVPHVGKPTFALPEDEMEVGVGIHGEPGRTRMKIKPADEIVELLMEPIISDLPYKSGDEVLMFVNGLGGTPLIELYIVYRKAEEIARKAGLKITRKFIGSYITSLEMAGTSITLLKLDDQLTKLWDAPVHTPALRWGV